MSEKAIISKEQAEALNELKEAGWNETLILSRHLDVVQPYGYHNARKVVSRIPVLTLAQALVNGYETEKTPHKRLAEAYEEASIASNEWERHYFRKGVQAALFILGIEVDGINKR